ncbi:transcriptional regulator, GntR family [Thermanaeromonas toyohensis ToBE]|uniref:Transcriptional regulator, GntR family n=1 Tax=Thermanaeromonas toyohensis ToBE TaxID=698762 RepID=A0A1W1W4H9_9FIRM|nr:FadR/GntR family transcriptional regulator [Thermanaeromonas toyohensis]SMB99974.1 transcriptional regulator, GntR family [Thermanaeromonas toyohensis ToBE]
MKAEQSQELFQIIKDPRSVYHRVVDEIKTRIFEGRLKPGDRLPAERELAEMLGVSRTSVREALKMLAAEGLVKIKHGQGAFIAEQDPDDYLQQFARRIFVNPKTIKDLFEIRKTLEPAAAAWAAERGTDRELEELATLIRQTKENLQHLPSGRLSLLARHDSQFHYNLAKATGNTVLVRIVESLMDLLADIRSRALSIPGRGEASVEEHSVIVEALLRRDPEAASIAMLRHLKNVERQVVPEE